MLSTGRLLRASRLLCDVKLLEGSSKCSFHIYAVNKSSKIVRLRNNDVLRRKHQPVVYGVVNFASSDAPASGTGQVLTHSVDNLDIKVLRELGILPPFEDDVPLSTTEEFAAIPPPDDFQTFSDQDISELPLSESNEQPVPHLSEFQTGELLQPQTGELLQSQTGELFQSQSGELLQPLTGELLQSQTGELLQEPIQTLEESTLPEPTTIIPKVNASPLDGSIEALDTVSTTDIGSVIPDSASDATATIIENLGKFSSEPAIQTLGLGSWTPVGLVQRSLEFLHVTLDLPWWGAIAAGTLVIRLIVFPLVIMAQRNAAKMNNCLPEMQMIQLKMSEARQRGDRLDAARYASELMDFMSTKGISPIKNMIVPLCQAPFFISMFMGIRGMAGAPVQSFHEGGLFWFVDLTLPDQFYLLPLITSATLSLTVEIGTDTAKLNSMGMMKYVLRAVPLIIFPFTVNFPAGVLVYWTTANFISLVQVGVLRVPRVREFFNIDPLVKIDKKALPMKDKGFVGGMKESWTNMKLSRELEERERLDQSNFLRAGRGAVKKTYKFDPTQPRPPPRNLSSIQLKKRD
ncbi:60Kd inner membrane protein [Nesidiocoris tenuis]|uniref:60Kd inner membrane protein n=2 Tax=Nesidiocoris tenuis TaxID=355587 RepID=A0ABN7BGP1_9HEMI|nr:60Kd inner membrane protein [Nesidiocoris tenuis]